MDLTAPIFVKFIDAQQHYVKSVCTKFHENRYRNMEGKVRSLSASTLKIRLSLKIFSPELMLVCQFSVKNSLTAFHENSTSGSVADIGSRMDERTGWYGHHINVLFFTL